MYEYGASGTTARAVDGDTLDLDIDLGFRLTSRQRVRLLGCNAPEHNAPGGTEATAFTTAWLASRPALIVHTVLDRGDKYGRLLARVIGSDGSDLTGALLAAGHAVGWDGHGRRPTVGV